MKVRIANELPNVPIGLVRLLGKVLVSPEDKVGFTMYDFTLQPEDDFSFTAIYPDQNHIYYCVEGALMSIRSIHIGPLFQKQLFVTAGIACYKELNVRMRSLVTIYMIGSTAVKFHHSIIHGFAHLRLTIDTGV